MPEASVRTIHSPANDDPAAVLDRIGRALAMGKAGETESAILDGFRAAVAHHQAGRWQEAKTLYRRIAALRPEIWQARSNFGLALEEQVRAAAAHRAARRLDEAVGLYQAILADQPDWVQGLRALAGAELERGRTAAAVRLLVRAADLATMRESVETAAELQADLARAVAALFTAALAEHQAGRLDAAVPLYRLGMVVQPEIWQARHNLNVILNTWLTDVRECLRTGRQGEAAALCARILELDPRQANALHALSRLEHREGRIARSLEFADQAASAWRRGLAVSRPRVLLYQHGGTDIWANLVCAFVDAGCDVFLIQAVDQIPDRIFDVVVSNHVTAKDLLDAGIRFQNFVIIQWTSIFGDYQAIREIAGAFAPGSGRRLLLWIADEDMYEFTVRYHERMCPEAIPIHCPLPLDAVRAGVIPPGELYTAENISQKTFSVERCLPLLDVFDDQAKNRKIIFAGQCFPMPNTREDTTLPWDFGVPFEHALGFAMDCYGSDPPMTMMGFAERCMEHFGIRIEAGTQREFHHFYALYRQLVCVQTRGGYNRTLKEAFGDDFLLFGRDWGRFGLKYEPDNSNISSLYRHMRVCVDYGSLGMDTVWFMRVMEIVKCGGNLLQLRKPRSHLYYEDFTDLVTFRDGADLVAKANALICATDLSEHERFRTFLKDRFGASRIGPRLLDAITRKDRTDHTGGA